MKNNKSINWKYNSKYQILMDKILVSVDELNAIISGAVQSALDAREKKEADTMLTRKAVAERLKVDVSTLWRWQKANVLPITARRGRFVYYSAKVISAFERGERDVVIK